MGKIVDFMCVGAPKCGTSSLHDILIQHPDIYLPEIKETNFFLLDRLYDRGIEYYKREFFKKRKGEKIAGEINPSYFFPDYIAERIYKAFGENLKLIFMFRNPVDRAYSHYWMNVRNLLEYDEFFTVFETKQERCKEDIENRRFCYIDFGLYARRLKNFLKYFKKENMFFIVFEEDFLKKRELTIKRLFKFLRVDNDIDINVNIKTNYTRMPYPLLIQKLLFGDNMFKKAGKLLIRDQKKRVKIKKMLDYIFSKKFNPPEIGEKEKQRLIKKYFLTDIKTLESLINRDLSVWYQE